MRIDGVKTWPGATECAPPRFLHASHRIIDDYSRRKDTPGTVMNVFLAEPADVGASVWRAPWVAHVVEIVGGKRGSVGVTFLGEAMEGVIGVRGGDGGGASLIGRGRDSAGEVAIVVVAVSDCACGI